MLGVDIQQLQTWLLELKPTYVSHEPYILLERYLLLQRIVVLTYSHRHEDTDLRDLCEYVGWMHFNEFEMVLRHIPRYVSSMDYPPIAFPKLVTVLTEAGKYDEAILVCQKALVWGLQDGTKSGYQGRIERIKKISTIEKSQSTKQDIETLIQRIQEKLDNVIRTSNQKRVVPILLGWQTDISIQKLTPEQRKFYKQWVDAWKKEIALDIEGQVNYVFLYIQTVLLRKISEEKITELLKLQDNYGAQEPDDTRRLRYYCGRWAADCCVYLQQYQQAIDVFPQLYINDLLSLKLLINSDLTGHEVLRLFGQTPLTQHGRSYLQNIAEAIENLLLEHQATYGKTIIQEWAKQVKTQKYRLFNSSFQFREISVTAYLFVDSPVKEIFIKQFKNIIRAAENRVRDTQNIPRIGEGWVSETDLYYQLKRIFAHLEILQHASPVWLGRQHLDIYIPEISIAIEYQGRQHDAPIAFFGGVEAFEQTQRRDALKRQLCCQNGIELIEVRPGYDISELINTIHKKRSEPPGEASPGGPT